LTGVRGYAIIAQFVADIRYQNLGELLHERT